MHPDISIVEEQIPQSIIKSSPRYYKNTVRIPPFILYYKVKLK